ncbi:uncharacterized protein LOC124206177 [Daphnia pulex]|uniref:uncharacterized protein LOC124206177 n=1 Tax=Daphnia pulex TaxID=6669 RepID=UPI001EDF1332|nr:uncharacterized protein LOC124206177 [Daphnia pulex]
MANPPVSTWTLDVCKGRQKVVRSRITGCHTRINHIVTAGLSRRDAEKLLADARVLLGELETIHDRVIELVDDNDVLTQQNNQHQLYAQTIDNCSALVEDYLLLRRDDASSVAVETPDQIARRQELETAYQRLRDARAEVAAAEQAIIYLGGDVLPTDGSELNPSDSASQVGAKPTKKIECYPAEAPDAWIDTYLAGKERPIVREKGAKSSVNVQLEAYTGRALDWFSWISMWFALVHITSKTPSEKLAILKNYLKGDLADIVHGHGGGEAGYKEVLQRLKSTCGSRKVIRAAHLRELDRMEAPRNDPQSFKRFSERVRTHLFNLSVIGETGHVDIIERLSLKLQLTDRLAWNNGRGGEIDNRNINDFGRWLTARATDYQNAYAIADDQQRSANGGSRNDRQQPSQVPNRFQQPQQQRRSARTYHGASSSQKNYGSTEQKEKKPTEPHCFKCEGSHHLEDCTFFKDLPISDRLTFTQRRGLCYGCFGVRHGFMNCTLKKECGIDGCKLSHHKLLHKENGPVERNARPHTLRSDRRQIAFKMLRLDALDADGEMVPVNILMDDGSDSTLIREGLTRRLRLTGQRQTLFVGGVGEESSVHVNSEYLELQLKTSAGETVSIQGSTIPSITKPVPVMEWEKLRGRWSHMEDLPPLRDCGGRVDILIGLDHAALITASESRFGKDDEPTASKTRLGWTLQGAVATSGGPDIVRIHHVQTSADSTLQLAEQVKRFCDTESFGTEFQSECMTAEHRRAVTKLEAETEKLDVGYAAPVLWIDDIPPEIPDSRRTAESRMKSIRNKFARESGDYETYYRAAMEKNFSEGYARRLTPEEIQQRPTKYFLPHFGVPKKAGRPELRLVFDAAAKSNGKCLNDFVTSGPALQNPLPAVLIRFREGEIGWSADIGAMFSRIRLKDADRPYHRFLWPEVDGTISTCEMTRLTFGVTCSPYVAIRTTWRAADDAGPEMKEAADDVREDIYVDDYLASTSRLEDAVRRATGVNKVLADGDFHLGHWVSNSSQLLSAVQPDSDNGTTVKTQVRSISDDPELILGIVWNPSTDHLGFRVKVSRVNYTRVGLLAQVAGLFDPLGTAAPMTVKAKIKLRELGVKGLQWEDPVVGDEKEWWEEYFQKIGRLKEIELPRCLFPKAEEIVRTELHTFADASEEACAASCYTRVVYQDGRVLVRHIKTATKLAPLKTVSVCKLELNAGLMGARLAKFVQTALKRKMDCRYFWTDSSTVRNWVRAVSSHYQVYVSHRIGEIQTLTEPHEWRFVPGRLNPADAATRSQMEEEEIPSWWLDGPPFLYEEEPAWPKDLPWMAAKEELRSVHVHLNSTAVEPPTVFNWKDVKISAQDIPALIRLEGEFLNLVKQSQREVYSEELKRLQQTKPLRSTSPLLPLTPFLDESGVLRLGGRLSRAKLPYDVMHPPLLSGKHPLSRMIIRAFHDSMHHLGTDFVLSHVRQHFWVTGGRELVKRVRNECVPCRRFRPKAALQMMADVHRARLGAGHPLFTYTSVDYFGPIDVTHGRGTAKRWGVLFTCMVTRAVYVDIAISLSASDFLMVLRRFISVYRKPAHMFSDNGTNLTGAERLLRVELDRLKDDSVLTTELKALRIEWFFQPAQTPHFGGSHESLVRSVKNAFYAALDQEKSVLRTPSDEVLRTLLFEVSGLLNSRPLTYCSSDPDDFRALTPNDFLNRAPVADLPAGDFNKALPRDHYGYVQRITNFFWDVWRGSFLQSMTSRKKWRTPARNFAVGDFILDDWKNAPRGRWRTGKIVKVYPGADGLVRAADVEFSTGILRRGTNQLALLEAYSPDPATEATESGSGENGAAI